MKSFLPLLISLASAQDDEPSLPSQACLKCKHIDTLSSFLYSASYCAEKDECLQDQWNYKNSFCATEWINGWKLDIDEDCSARDGGVGACKPFISSMDQVGYNDTRSITLPAGNKCTIEVDATDFVARVLFEPYT